MRRSFRDCTCLAMVLLITAGAAAPPQINYQARLTDSFGVPVSGTHALYLSIYQDGDGTTAGSGTLEFSEMGSVGAVNGIANYAIGTGVNLFGGVLNPNMFSGSEAILAAPETRASTPVRIVRDPQSREAIQHFGLFPIGEGAGYAGGIVSAAVDGMKSADIIIKRYAPLR